MVLLSLWCGDDDNAEPRRVTQPSPAHLHKIQNLLIVAFTVRLLN